MRALDISNYTDEIDGGVVDAWCAQGIGLVIVQAFPPPYGQYAEQRRQHATLRAHRCDQHPVGLPQDAYIYDYLGSPTWRDGALSGLDRAERELGFAVRMVWLDEEDVESEAGWAAGQRVDAIARSCAAVDEWCVARGKPRAGIYTGAWWWVARTGNSTAFADRKLWDSDYDGVADTERGWSPYGGWPRRAIKQHVGTSCVVVCGLDQNVLSTAEADAVRGLTQEQASVARETPEDWQWSTWREAAINLKAIADELGRQAESARKGLDALSAQVQAADTALAQERQEHAERVNALVGERDAARERSAKLDRRVDELEALLDARPSLPEGLGPEDVVLARALRVWKAA